MYQIVPVTGNHWGIHFCSVHTICKIDKLLNSSELQFPLPQNGRNQHPPASTQPHNHHTHTDPRQPRCHLNVNMKLPGYCVSTHHSYFFNIYIFLTLLFLELEYFLQFLYILTVGTLFSISWKGVIKLLVCVIMSKILGLRKHRIKSH